MEGSVSWLERWKDEDFAYLTTIGRRTGNPHTIEIWFGTHDGRLYMLSGGLDRVDWVRNLKKIASVTVRIGDDSRPGTAYLVSDPDEELRARYLLAEKYQEWEEGRTLSGWARTALPVGVVFDEGDR